jgi:glycosyltransferase involved in cell wall biosynthesis
MATGCPVIAYAKGGALETVIDGKTGILFKEQNIASLKHAVEKFQLLNLKPELIRKQAEKFDQTVFNKNLLDFIENKWEAHQKHFQI